MEQGYIIQKSSHPKMKWVIRYRKDHVEALICLVATRKIAEFIVSQLTLNPLDSDLILPITDFKSIVLECLSLFK